MQAPKITDASELKLATPEIHHLKSGQRLWVLRDPGLPLVKAQFLFHHGLVDQYMPMLNSSTWSNAFAGTKRHSTEDMALKLDTMGLMMEEESEVESSGFTVNIHNDFFGEFLDLCFEVFDSANFPESELQRYRERRRQSFLINSQKASIVASRSFSKAFYGGQHPLGIQVTPEHFDMLNQDRLKKHWEEELTRAPLDVLVSGNPKEEDLDRISTWMEGRQVDFQRKPFPERNPEGSEITQDWEKAMQSALKIGLEMPGANHPDYVGLKFTVQVLGGYFGSRLMKELREEKGYTYGVHAGLVSNSKLGVMTIRTEVGKEFREESLGIIEKEIENLVAHPPLEDEILKVRRYMQGQILEAADGVMSQQELWKSAWQLGLPEGHFENFYSKLNSLDTHQVLALANKYLKGRDLTKIIIG